jgi:hypothetical protein
MATVLGDVQWNALLKELYPDGLPAEIMMRKHVLLSKLTKDGDAYGDHMVIPVVFDNPAGRSADIASLLGTNGPIAPTQSVKFLVSLSSDYAATWINELTIRKAANDRGAFVNARKFEVDGLLRQLGNSLAHALYRAGDGTVGQGDGAWTITGKVITLKTRADAKFFGIGMQLDFIANSSGSPNGSPRALAATYRVVVTAVDEDGGKITCAKDANGAAVTNISSYYTSLANDDFIAPVGDYNSAYATTGAVKVRGLAAWIPLTAPVLGSDSFWSVDRGVHPTRLAGSRLNDSTAPAEDSIMALAEVMHERGANPDIVLISPRQFTKISKRLNAKVEYEGAGGEAKYGFMTFAIATSAGMLPVYADPDCPEDRGYILTMDTWRIKHLGLPEIVTTDGLSALRRPGLDQIEIRCRYYAQLVCYAPGENGVFAVS